MRALLAWTVELYRSVDRRDKLLFLSIPVLPAIALIALSQWLQWLSNLGILGSGIYFLIGAAVTISGWIVNYFLELHRDRERWKREDHLRLYEKRYAAYKAFVVANERLFLSKDDDWVTPYEEYRNSINEVRLVASPGVRTAAESLARVARGRGYDWNSEKYEDVDKEYNALRKAFWEVARRELEIVDRDTDVPETDSETA